VAIMTSGSHAELAGAAARAGLAVFCEKPLAYTRAEADGLAAEDPRLMLGYMKLYDPAVERARALLAGRPTPRSVEITVLHPPSPPQLAHAGLLPPAGDIEPASVEQLVTAERELVERALGPVPRELALVYSEVLLGSVVHDLAVLRYLAGGPLTFDYGDAWPALGDASSVALLGQLSGGTRVSIRWHYLEGYPAYREEVRVHDEQGTVALTFPSPYLLHAPTVLTVVDSDGGAERVSEIRSTVEAFEQQWLAFAAFAHDGVAPRAGIAEGRLDIVACQGAAAVLGERLGLDIGGEAAGSAA
jgi:myo-inositol 2-dehydrogenase / D-chiro-inositol 1-dehydrogenase